MYLSNYLAILRGSNPISFDSENKSESMTGPISVQSATVGSVVTKTGSYCQLMNGLWLQSGCGQFYQDGTTFPY